MEQEYLTIKEFAERAGVTPQAIYKRLGNMQDYIRMDGKKKRISADALNLFTNVEKTVEKQEDTATVELLKKTIDMLEKQLEIKDSQINELNDRLKETSRRLEESHILIDQSQKLHAVTEVKQIDSAEQKEERQKWWQRLFK